MQSQRALTVEEICSKLKPVFGKKIDDLYLKYAMADSKEEREEIAQMVNALYHKHLSELLNKKVLLEPPEKEDMDGEYSLATISYADKKLYPFKLREKDWVRHFCISGMSGSGKTTLAFHVIKNFIEKGKPFLVFDWKKSFRPLMIEDGEIMTFTVGNENVSNYFKININQPPENIPPKEWINVLCDLITESFFASYGVHKIILETLDEAFKDFGVYSGSKNYPTWNEIKWRLEGKLEKKKGREASWLMSAMRIAHILTFGNFGKALNYKGKDSMTIEDLLNKKVIFELNALGTIEKKFFCEMILTYIYKFKKAREGAISQNFDHAIVVDEAHNIFLKEKTHFVKESVTDMIYREMREYGTALVCLDQHISKISDTVAGNSACHVAFQQQLPQDIETISGLMQLRDKRQFFSMLPVGSAIVKLSERYTHPFLVQVEDVELRKEKVSDKDVAEKMKCIFLGKEVEDGKDPEFKEALMQPEYSQEKERMKRKLARVPNHALFNGEHEEFQGIGTGIGKDWSFQKLEDFQEIPSELSVDYAREDEEVQEVEGITEQVQEKQPKKTQLKMQEIAVEKPEKPVETEIAENYLNPVQEILYEFVQKKLAMKMPLREIERVLNENTHRGNYSILDVSKVVNYALEQSFVVVGMPRSRPRNNTQNTPKNVITQEKQNIYKPQKHTSEHNITENIVQDNQQDKEQEEFLIFLQNNPNHDYSTVDIYKKLGLSARKGNKIKNQLLDKGLIKVEEKKYDKGWKKLIRLN